MSLQAVAVALKKAEDCLDECDLQGMRHFISQAHIEVCRLDLDNMLAADALEGIEQARLAIH